ncbi:MAG: hypothetical protein LBE62_09500 [Azonexus sp.]|jgi:hypothetical protein|nr:hypothetical protein [Azonexus sp.]
MKKAVKILTTALCLVAITAISIDEASARRWHRGGPRVSIGIGFGAGYWGGGYYGNYYRGYYPWGGYFSPWWATPVVSPVVVTQPQPAPVYIQQTPPAAASAAPVEAVWYYCRDPAGYYPYVSECQGNWLKVLPQ